MTGETTPMCDAEVPARMIPVQRSSANLNWSVISLPELPAPTDSKFQPLFEQKVRICENLYDFVGDARERTAIDNKTKTMNEIRCWVGRLERPHVNLTFRMVEKNIVRHIPEIYRLFTAFLDLPSYVEPAWPHVSIAYSILNRLAAISPALPQFCRTFYRKLLVPSDTPDANERSAIVQFYVSLLTANPTLREDVASFLEGALLDYRTRLGQSPYRAVTILQILHFVIEQTLPLLPIASRIFAYAIIPMFADPYLLLFHSEMEKLLDFFLEDNPSYSVLVIRVLVNQFPILKAKKMVIVLGVMQRIVWHLPSRQLQQWALPVTRTLARALESFSEPVAHVSLAFWSRAEGARVLKKHKKVVLPVIIPVVYAAAAGHWSPAVRTAAQACLSVFQKHDSRLVQEIVRGGTTKVTSADPPQWKHWALIAKSAQQLYTDINLSDKLAEITAGFKPGTPAGTATGRPTTTKPFSDGSAMPPKPRLMGLLASG
jgi:hypothetical protein